MTKGWVPLLLLALVHLICARPDYSDHQPRSGSSLAKYTMGTLSRFSWWLDETLSGLGDTRKFTPTAREPALSPALENIRPEQPPIKRALRGSTGFLRSAQEARSMDFEETNLDWKWWNGYLPDGAVSIYNSYSQRVDYICKVSCQSGYYDSTSSNPACSYTLDGAGYTSTQFYLLVNKDSFEILEWKEGSDGSVTANSIRTCANEDIYVGKNEYGLGEVKVRDKKFHLPWGGSCYSYGTYQVLETYKDIVREHLMDVMYQTAGVTPLKYPPEVLNKGTIFNYECQTLNHMTTLSKTVVSSSKWEINFSVTVGVGTTIVTKIPFILKGQISFNSAFTYKLTKESTYTETTIHALTLETVVPVSHSCTIEMLGKKYGLDIPFTARLKRTYRNGETTWTTITGTFRAVQISEVQADMERCELLPDVKPC
ncbi:natterin-3-like [Phycodurus eques]|uniref:natterin-3-like n=1 Tax=Phycodurus eques TaxID=693459 RepID=UPI002ACD2F08|nr:natterin-3-like [Phycodurus eques]XP_061528574.1 natterin-3-like [Phycodurus eques]XP_061528575.1 natterin-3-like [Phycodurus eques]